MRAFLALAWDVPRRIRTGWFFWILLLLVAGVLALVALPLGTRTTDDSLLRLTWFGNVVDLPDPDHPGKELIDVKRSIEVYLASFIGIFFGCGFGVFAGLVALADAVSSAFVPGAAEINLPKPVRRGTIIIARHLGALWVATGFAVLLIGGAVAIAALKTGVLAPIPLVYIPVSVASFGVLHAVGSIASSRAPNALVSAFASVGMWLASLATYLPNMIPGAHDLSGMLKHIVDGVDLLHRVIPRPTDIPGLANRIIEHKFGNAVDVTPAYEYELMGQSAAWWLLALFLAILVARRRDF
ncbi:MAG TPA: hypothetical protein VFF73_33490 [Planctomycetota bacterium]|nr:hypothetical protein [Planctomycetota bacterium]